VPCLPSSKLAQFIASLRKTSWPAQCGEPPSFLSRSSPKCIPLAFSNCSLLMEKASTSKFLVTRTVWSGTYNHARDYLDHLSRSCWSIQVCYLLSGVNVGCTFRCFNFAFVNLCHGFGVNLDSVDSCLSPCCSLRMTPPVSFEWRSPRTSLLQNDQSVCHLKC
jgi:hypothetical protein